jgi:hypothetical protein
MAPSWSFQQIYPPSSTDFSRSILSVTSEKSSGSSHPLDDDHTRYAFSYDRLYLLGLPLEVRNEIWQTIFNDITASASKSEWDKRPSTVYSGLDLTCHQIRDEIALFWPRTIIQHDRIQIFVQPGVPNLKDFQRLTLEISLNQPLDFFQAAAATLKQLAPVLQDLRLFFVGSDRFQIPLSLDGCGLHGPNLDLISKRLTIDGQRHSIRQPLFLALRSLYNLRSMVLSNHNYPILPKFVLERKPFLKYLHMVVDPRTTVHKNLDRGGIHPFMLAPLQQDFPPVRILHEPARSAVFYKLYARISITCALDFANNLAGRSSQYQY